MARARNPDSPYRNKNAITPTSGGNTTGSAISAPSVFRPGKSNHSNRNASGMPITAARTTLTSEIQTLAHSAAHSPGRVTNARSAVPPPLAASPPTMRIGYTTSHARSKVSNTAERSTRPKRFIT